MPADHATAQLLLSLLPHDNTYPSPLSPSTHHEFRPPRFDLGRPLGNNRAAFTLDSSLPNPVPSRPRHGSTPSQARATGHTRRRTDAQRRPCFHPSLPYTPVRSIGTCPVVAPYLSLCEASARQPGVSLTRTDHLSIPSPSTAPRPFNLSHRLCAH
ncbi:hypothetical protein MAPG_06394 [Magnaporthiopsis poae ATCC 64411]|uniref:Uncharacterized protein n=1 Tax=Magnaporthiopsis poae (strain ATCC 64411 / 73-15) TaxID=644358 RepID=A0A0C4E1X0_MAGP6|nr:hypothetical protein MAPG_06394 [Magnaporthiopsis poae ATCC 64411]